MTGPQMQRRWDAEGATLERGRDACVPVRTMSAVEHWAWRAFYVAIAATGIFICSNPSWIA